MERYFVSDIRTFIFDMERVILQPDSQISKEIDKVPLFYKTLLLTLLYNLCEPIRYLYFALF